MEKQKCIGTKACCVCKIVKPMDAFAILKKAKDGRQFRCRACQKIIYTEYMKRPSSKKRACERVKKYYNTPRGRQKQHERDTSEHKKQYMAKYRQTPSGIATRKKGQQRISRLKRHLAYSAVRRKLKKQPCSVCGTFERVHAHHHDYSRPLDVTWFCPKHHAAEHSKLRASA